MKPDLARKSEVARRINVPYSSLNYWIIRSAIQPVKCSPVVLFDVEKARVFMEAVRTPRKKVWNV